MYKVITASKDHVLMLSNSLMSACRDLKRYIKTSSCYPDRCTKSDYENIMKDFQDSEKVSNTAIYKGGTHLHNINNF